MKKLLVVLAVVVLAVLAFSYPALGGNDGPGPGPDSSSGISGGDGADGNSGGTNSHGPAPNSGDGIPDGSGMSGSYSGGDNGFTVSGTDLINGIHPIVNDPELLRPEEGVTTDGVAALTNGLFGPPGLLDRNEVVAIHEYAVLTYDLDTKSNPYGYDITNINTYAGWRDGGRDDQKYSILYTTIDDPLTFLTLIDVDYSLSPYCSKWGCGPHDTAVFISDDSGVLASGVASIQFSFYKVENRYVGYRELDVIGKASAAPAPEPATLLLLGAGLAGLAGFSRKKFKKKN